jgi:hypothetical protein
MSGALARHSDVAILQPGYLPWLGYFDLVAMSDMFVLYDDVQFDKGGWRNRHTEWQQSHLALLRQVYARAPFFDWCYPMLEGYLTARPYHWLLDLAVSGHQVIAGLLQLETPIRLSSDIGFAGIGRTERLVAICRTLGATRYIATDASRTYMTETLWSEAGIALVYQGYPHPTYRQFEGAFQSHLSIVDALMFLGPEARQVIGISHAKSR